MKKEWEFYQWSTLDLEKHFDVDPNKGLSDKRAFFRIEKYGLNTLDKLKEIKPWEIFISQFDDFFVILLLIATVISYFVDGLLQSGILLFIVLVNVLLGFFQEYRAENALAALKDNFKAKCKVLRDGKVHEINNEQVVPGDIVMLETGDILPADLRIIESNNLQINESILTGESMPVLKNSLPLPIDTPLSERSNMAYSSTHVLAGRGVGIVVETGLKTEFGKIANLVEKSKKKTPLEIQVIYLGKIMTIFAFSAGILVFFLGIARGFSALSLLTFVISLIVAVVPESLPTVITLALAIGVIRMTQKKAIVRKMAVIEALGTTNIIATDKTGTLTNNHLSLSKLYNYLDGNIEEWTSGTVSNNQKNLLQYGLLCSNIDMGYRGKLIGDPLDVALMEKAQDLHEAIITNCQQYKRISEIPFDSENRYMSVIVDKKGEQQLIVKGAVEKILEFCIITPSYKQKVLDFAHQESQNGLRIIAIAKKDLKKSSLSSLDRLELVGLFAFLDEPSAGIKSAIAEVISAGIRPVMLTGDHPQTAKFIANQIGLEVDDGQVLTGTELNLLKGKELKKALSHVKVFARVTPEDKINIVSLLQKYGYSVAVTGDGVNDAPALKEATVGIAMGQKGTDIAKESSDIILSDDKYATIISAVEYGRAIYDNIRNAIVFLFSGNFDELFLVATAFIFNMPLPLTTLQILWVNLITDSFPALALSFEQPSKSVLKEKPRPANMTVLKSSIYYAIYLAGVSFVLSLCLYMVYLHGSLEKARTMIFCFVVFLELVFSFSIRSQFRFWQNPKSFFTNKPLIYAILLSVFAQSILFLAPLRKIFKITVLSIQDVLVLIVMCLITFIAAEIVRYLLDRSEQKRAAK